MGTRILTVEDDERIPFGNELSYKDALRAAGGGASPALQRVERRLADRPSLKTAVDAWLSRTPIQGSNPGDADDAARRCASATSSFLTSACDPLVVASSRGVTPSSASTSGAAPASSSADAPSSQPRAQA